MWTCTLIAAARKNPNCIYYTLFSYLSNNYMIKRPNRVKQEQSPVTPASRPPVPWQPSQPPSVHQVSHGCLHKSPSASTPKAEPSHNHNTFNNLKFTQPKESHYVSDRGRKRHAASPHRTCTRSRTPRPAPPSRRAT